MFYLPEDGLSEYLVQYTHAGQRLWPFCCFVDVLAVVLGVLSLLRVSLLIVDDAEEHREDELVTELLATELLLDARLSRLPLLLSPLCLCKGDASPQCDENASLSR